MADQSTNPNILTPDSGGLENHAAPHLQGAAATLQPEPVIGVVYVEPGTGNAVPPTPVINPVVAPGAPPSTAATTTAGVPPAPPTPETLPATPTEKK